MQSTSFESETNMLLFFFTYIINNELHVNSQSNIREIKIYDVSGKEVINFKPSESQMNFSANFQFSKGVYFAAISLENNQIINKKLLN